MLRRRLPILIVVALMVAAATYAIGISAIGDDHVSASPGGLHLPSRSPESQAEALADGLVTFEEVEEGVRRAVACVQAAGYGSFVDPGKGLRNSTVGVGPVATAAEIPAANEVAGACIQEHLVWLQIKRSDQQASAPKQERDHAYEMVSACLARMGILPAGSKFAEGDASRLIDAHFSIDHPEDAELELWFGYMDCVDEVEEQTGLRPIP